MSRRVGGGAGVEIRDPCGAGAVDRSKCGEFAFAGQECLADTGAVVGATAHVRAGRRWWHEAWASLPGRDNRTTRSRSQIDGTNHSADEYYHAAVGPNGLLPGYSRWLASLKMAEESSGQNALQRFLRNGDSGRKESVLLPHIDAWA